VTEGSPRSCVARLNLKCGIDVKKSLRDEFCVEESSAAIACAFRNEWMLGGPFQGIDSPDLFSMNGVI
jgi:hypothetical protein